MQARTVFRLAMLKNGFQPLLNDCKRPIEKGWPKQIVDEAEVLSWDRSALASTGLKIDGDLAVIDVDVAEAWNARVDEPFRRLASRRWYRGNDPDDPAAVKHLVECFGSLGTRQFAVDGPHTRNGMGEVVSTYRFAGGMSPATTPRTSLPVLPKAAYEQACDLFDEIAAAAGLAVVKGGSHGEADLRRFELDADTEIETRDHGVMTVAELERLVRKQRPRDLRCSGTFHDPTRVRTDSHLINWGRRGLGIWDAMTETTWHRRERVPSARFEFLAQLMERSPFQ